MSQKMPKRKAAVSRAAKSGFEEGVRVAKKHSKETKGEKEPTRIDLAATLNELQLKVSPHKEEKLEGWEILKREQDSLGVLRMMKGILFKRDQPYRTLLPLQGQFSTNSSGVLNVTQSVLSLPNVSEWSAIDALFDEVFVHSMRFRFFPINNLGGGVGTAASGVTGGITAISSANIVNGPLSMVHLFNGATSYSTASAMNANSTLVVHNSSEKFETTWRNSVRFEKHGPSLSTIATSTNIGWQGWTEISGVPYLGGLIQFRMLNDNVVGTGSAAVTLGTYLCQYDCSFRARA
jgi:hypothetical protein